jgi:hypothetical protein
LCDYKEFFRDKEFCRKIFNPYFEPPSCIPWALYANIEDFVEYCAQAQPRDIGDFLSVFKNFLAPPPITKEVHNAIKVFCFSFVEFRGLF